MKGLSNIVRNIVGQSKLWLRGGDKCEGKRRCWSGTKEERGVGASNSRSNCPKEHIAVKR